MNFVAKKSIFFPTTAKETASSQHYLTGTVQEQNSTRAEQYKSRTVQEQNSTRAEDTRNLPSETNFASKGLQEGYFASSVVTLPDL